MGYEDQIREAEKLLEQIRATGQSDSRISEQLGSTASTAVPKEGYTSPPLDFAEAYDLAENLEDSLRTLHAEDMASQNANNTWLQQIDRNVKNLQEIVNALLGVVIGSSIIVILLLLGVALTQARIGG